MLTRCRTALVLVAGLLCACRHSDAQQNPPDLSGLWGGKLRYGPDIRGPVILIRSEGLWTVDIAGFRIPAVSRDAAISFDMPDGKGTFRGKLKGSRIVGHWYGEKSSGNGISFASSLVLDHDGPNRWRGNLVPLDQAFTFYMPVTRRADGTYYAYLRNPESNQGVFLRASSVRIKGDVVELVGGSGKDSDAIIATGRYADGVITIPFRGQTFDLERVKDSSSEFYPRGKPGERYRYAAPLSFDDGWPVASVEAVGISRPAIEKFVQMLIDQSMDSVSTPQIHSVLIARHGKLVVEEYFHGYDRYEPHDLRSASKSWVAVLLGAAMRSGVPIRMSTPVYQTMLGSAPQDLEPRKRAMTLEHLISMTAGYNCSGEGAPGDEDTMQQQTAELDWIRYTLNVPMKTAPGDTIVYCSIEPNLAGAMLSKIAGEPLEEMFQRLVAAPLRITGYHLFMTPTREVYGGGGHRFTTRDFMKLPQLMLNDGKWEGKEITTAEWARKSTTDLRQLGRTQRYGWPYKDGKVRGYFAGGNGGQIFMAVPELDLVIAFTGGNYNSNATFTAQQVYVPKWILPAVTR
jgi:CubicO group peptidase (beta-lactamase class C family)